MTRLTELLRVPGPRLEFVTRVAADPLVETVFIVERLADLSAAPTKAVAVLGADACRVVDSYQFDIAVRHAVGRGVSAIVLSDPDAPEVTSTSADTARRFGMSILRQQERVNLADLVTALDTALRGPADVALRQVANVCVLATTRAHQPEQLVAEVSKIVDVDIGIRDQPTGELVFPVSLIGEPDRWVVILDSVGRSRPELQIVGTLLANALALGFDATRRAEELPIRSRAELLSEILDSSTNGRAKLLARARGIGLPIDGWHVVVRIESDDSAERPDDEVAAFEAREELGRIVLDAVRASGGTWHLARTERSLVVIRMYRNDPGPSASADATKSANQALRDVARRIPLAVTYCGVGTAHSSASGMINSAAESRAAVAASRARNRPNIATAFDSLGLRRSLVEWYASHTARKAVETVLAPLDRMGSAKADSAIRTLQTYLDNHGSLSQTATALHLHRNSVAYRVSKIFAELDVDPDSPDDWLLLQLACRARGLT